MTFFNATEKLSIPKFWVNLFIKGRPWIIYWTYFKTSILWTIHHFSTRLRILIIRIIKYRTWTFGKFEKGIYRVFPIWLILKISTQTHKYLHIVIKSISILTNHTTNLIFSSLEPKETVSFSDQNFPVICRRRLWRCCRYKRFSFSTSSSETLG